MASPLARRNGAGTVKVTGVEIPFGDLVGVCLKVMLATTVAMAIISLVPIALMLLLVAFII